MASALVDMIGNARLRQLPFGNARLSDRLAMTGNLKSINHR